MKSITAIIIILISASLRAQVKDSITSEWVNIGFRQTNDYEPFKESEWVDIENKTDVAYDSIRVQYRITLEGIIQQRQRFYYTK